MAPIRLAGIMNEYSNKAMPHDMRMTKKSGQSLDVGTISINLSWPYHAKVMKTLDTISKRMVYKPFMDKLFWAAKIAFFLGATVLIIPIFALSNLKL